MTLGDFLKRECANHRPWNCSTMPADWCLVGDFLTERGYPDFAAEWREVTDTAACEAIPAEAGGLLPLWERGIGDALPEASLPLCAGDIAIVAAHGLEAGAIFTGERWAMKAARGVHWIAPDAVTVVKAWRP